MNAQTQVQGEGNLHIYQEVNTNWYQSGAWTNHGQPN
jgi:hypothetical protein